MAPHSSTLAWQIPWMEDCKEIPPVYHKGKQSWIFTGRTDAEIPILWPSYVKSQFIVKDSAGKIEGNRRKGWQRIRWLNSITNSVDMSLSTLWEIVESRETWRAAVNGVTKSQTWLSDWNELNWRVWTTGLGVLASSSGGFGDLFPFKLDSQPSLRNIKMRTSDQACWICKTSELHLCS